MAGKRPAKTNETAAKAAPSQVKVQPAKGRPMLHWVGKRPLTRVPAYPAQHIETFDPAGATDGPPAKPEVWHDWPEYPRGGLLFHGDNREVLAHLLGHGYRGKLRLAYIDPPFASGADYVRKVSLRGDGAGAMDGDGQSLGEQVQYADIWANDSYLQFMFERLLLIRELLNSDGMIVVHCDWNVSHMMRILLDEVFGPEQFVNEIIWQHAVIGAGRGLYRRLPKAHETLLVYARSDRYTFNTDDSHVRVPYKDRITKNLSKDERGYYYTRGRTGTDNPWSKDPRYLRTYVDVEKGKLVHDVWDDITTYRAQGAEYVGYPTQKPQQLIERVLALGSNPGDLVLDCFVGSGTTAAAAQKLGRRWIGCDINRGAIQTTSMRLQTIIRDQIENRPLALDDADHPAPAQLAFTVWRVNDYDLQIQHNEAVNLACELIGIERLRSDGFFDGTLGKSLAKVVPFNHPLTPLDLEEVKRELEARPDEDRPVTLVCLGIEIGAQAWIEDWNRMRRGKNAVNRIEVIELRTDARYGGVIRHEPARAKVKVRRAKDRLHIEIEDFVSPTIIQRLQAQANVLQPQIEDWRAMVDSVSIDPSYDGSVLNIAIADVPERKSDLVSGTYDLEAPAGETTVAVKIIDMLGEEVLVTERV